MYAIVTEGNITKTFNNPRRITINNIRYSTKIYSLWSVEEKKAIGLYEVEYDNTNKKDEAWYINTNQTLAYNSSGDKVVASYGTATARAIADSLWTQQDSDDGDLPSDKEVGDVKVEGLKTVKKRMIDQQCAGILQPSDWLVIKAKETSTTMNSAWKTWRAAVRTKCNSMQTQIDGAANVDALAALFTYTEQEDGSVTRPLGEFPIKE